MRLAGYRCFAPFFNYQKRHSVETKFKPERVDHVEIVSHCWQYSHFLKYQLSSLVLNEPVGPKITMTVYYSDTDQDTVNTLRFFEKQKTSKVHWNWQCLPKQLLMRRAIGRNMAALKTVADWIWFCDCDQYFGRDCLDSVCSALGNVTDPLAYPRVAQCSALLDDEHPIIQRGRTAVGLLDLDAKDFKPVVHHRAIGGVQILRGEVARESGYCNGVSLFLEEADKWQKTYEDRALRVAVGSKGKAIDVVNFLRIEHVRKGRKEQMVKAA